MKTLKKLQKFSTKLNRLCTYGYQVNVQEPNKLKRYEVFHSLKEAEKFVNENKAIIIDAAIM